MNGRSKVAVIGAGFVGASAAYAMALQQVCSELVLIDVNHDKAVGEAADIRHGLPFLGQMKIYAGDYSDIQGSDVIVLTAGANRKPGESRLDLAKKNTVIARGITEDIMKYYDGGVILVVANPVDILTYMISEWTGLPKGMVIGSGTSLDTIRFRSALATRLDIDVENIHGYVIGEHGDSQVPVWSNTHIAGIQVDNYCAKNGILLNDDVKVEILEQVKTDGAQIIKRKGATYFGVAVCISSLTTSLLRDSSTIRTISTTLDGEFGVSGVAVSLPTVIGNHGATKILTPKLSDAETQLFIKSTEACKAVLADCQ